MSTKVQELNISIMSGDIKGVSGTSMEVDFMKWVTEHTFYCFHGEHRRQAKNFLHEVILYCLVNLFLNF